MGEWPVGFPWGGIRTRTAAGAAFLDLGITPKKRLHHTELWRDNTLIAVQRSDQIVVYSRRHEDMRTLLLAAHRQWGSVELTGSSKFKAHMADIAAELDIPIANPELALRIERRRSKIRIAREGETVVFASPDEGKTAPMPDVAKIAESHPIVGIDAPQPSNLDGSKRRLK